MYSDLRFRNQALVPKDVCNTHINRHMPGLALTVVLPIKLRVIKLGL